MLMSPDSSSADPDPIQSSYHSAPSMIQVPECTQSHGGSVPTIIKPHHIQIVDYKKIEPSTNGYMSPTKVHAPVFHQKPTSMGPKSDEDLNLGKHLRRGLWVDGRHLESRLISAHKWARALLTQFVLGRTLTLNSYEARLCLWRWKKFNLRLCWFRSRSRAVHENKRESNEREKLSAVHWKSMSMKKFPRLRLWRENVRRKNEEMPPASNWFSLMTRQSSAIKIFMQFLDHEASNLSCLRRRASIFMFSHRRGRWTPSSFYDFHLSCSRSQFSWLIYAWLYALVPSLSLSFK